MISKELKTNNNLQITIEMCEIYGISCIVYYKIKWNRKKTVQ